MLGENSKYCIIDSTLTECSYRLHFTLEQKQNFITLLDKFGIEYIELPNLSTSFQELQSLLDFKKTFGLKIKFVYHLQNDTTNHNILNGLDCIKICCDDLYNVDNHNLKQIRTMYPNIEIIFSIGDCFLESDMNAVSNLILTIEDSVDRISIYDTTGIAIHTDVEDVIALIKNTSSLNVDIESCFNNDYSSAVYNSFIALLNGCTHINTSVTSNQNGMTDLSAFIARIYSLYPETLNKYKLHLLNDVYSCVNVNSHTYNNIIKTRDNIIFPSNNIFTSNMSLDHFKNFLLEHLDNVIYKLDTVYIEKLYCIIKSNIENTGLCDKMNSDIDFAIDYILKYIS
jgi:hypothetical protein